jgi:hypothetical protein
MTKEQIFDLKPGERVLKFNEKEIRLITDALAVFSIDTEELARRSRQLGMDIAETELMDSSRTVKKLQFSIENGDHDV